MVLGLIYLVSLILKIKGYRLFIKYGLIAVFVIFMWMSVGVFANKTLNGAYQGILRVNPYQYELAKWLRTSDIPEDAEIYHMGAISLAKTRWIWMIGHRFLASSDGEPIDKYNITHVVMDYSDFALIGDQSTVNKLQEWEKQNLANKSLIYNKDYIKVYEFED